MLKYLNLPVFPDLSSKEKDQFFIMPAKNQGIFIYFCSKITDNH